MVEDTAHGTRGRYQLPIEFGKIREFARATKSKSEHYQGPGAPIPPTFLTTARLVWEPADLNPVRDLALNQEQVLHGEEEYEFFGELPRAGDTLVVETYLDGEWEKQGRRGGVMRFARVVNRFFDESGTQVAEQRSTLIETARPPAGGSDD